MGLPWDSLKTVKLEKGDYLAADVTEKGRTAADVLTENIPDEIDRINWPKNMYWRKRGEVFVRPVRWLVAMLDDQVVPLELFGIAAGKTSRGHRIIGSGRCHSFQAQRLRGSPARREGAGRRRA